MAAVHTTRHERLSVAVPEQPIDVEPFQCARERVLLEQLEADENVTNFVEMLLVERNPTQLRRALLRNAMKLTRQTAPEQIEIIETIKRIIKLDMDIELYVEPGETLAAWCAPPTEKAPAFLGVTSAVIEKIQPDELLFIFGHELGHLRFGHNRYPIPLMLQMGHGTLSTLEVFRLLAWSRHAEITADRVGLLCCQSLEAASRTFFRLTSGVTSDKLRFSVTDYLKQLEEIQSLDDIDDTSEDWYSTHPFNPLRLKALELFSRTNEYQAVAGDTAGTLSMAQMEAKLDEFLAIMNPSYLSDSDDETAVQVKEFVTFGAIFVALANGELEQSEIDQITEIVGYEAFAENLDPIFEAGPEATAAVLTEKAEALRIKMIPASRNQLVRDLVVVAIADGTIDEMEMTALVNIAMLLEVSPDFVEMIANELQVQKMFEQLVDEDGNPIGMPQMPPDAHPTFAPSPTM